jgi:hypothetical protein
MLASRHRREIVSGVVAPFFVYVMDHMPARETMTKEPFDNYDMFTTLLVWTACIFDVTLLGSSHASRIFLTP